MEEIKKVCTIDFNDPSRGESFLNSLKDSDFMIERSSDLRINSIVNVYIRKDLKKSNSVHGTFTLETGENAPDPRELLKKHDAMRKRSER